MTLKRVYRPRFPDWPRFPDYADLVEEVLNEPIT
jgi:hypothetical protein